MGAAVRLPVGRMDACTRRLGRAPVGVEVGAAARLPVGCMDVLARRFWRATGGAAVGAGARLLLDQGDVCRSFPASLRDLGMGAAVARVGRMPAT